VSFITVSVILSDKVAEGKKRRSYLAGNPSPSVPRQADKVYSGPTDLLKHHRAAVAVHRAVFGRAGLLHQQHHVAQDIVIAIHRSVTSPLTQCLAFQHRQHIPTGLLILRVPLSFDTATIVATFYISGILPSTSSLPPSRTTGQGHHTTHERVSSVYSYGFLKFLRSSGMSYASMTSTVCTILSFSFSNLSMLYPPSTSLKCSTSGKSPAGRWYSLCTCSTCHKHQPSRMLLRRKDDNNLKSDACIRKFIPK
jgi:hypothetical protein